MRWGVSTARMSRAAPAGLAWPGSVRFSFRPAPSLKFSERFGLSAVDCRDAVDPRRRHRERPERNDNVNNSPVVAKRGWTDGHLVSTTRNTLDDGVQNVIYVNF
ncbi:hypothetical protein EVAR_23324_1 [Eumeta japonica]|uniref:Uncharacterized protein n=1 Tax=Eumeta variegata TaxID=151549 RepID=A0A4C1XYD9_EUMVA|nr:hypothetical protein EVAR_23324_1 [Eumeta japonica]